MSTPKPMAPSKPLTFTPPQKLGGQTRSSELPFVEGADNNVVERKKRPQNKKSDKPVRNKGHRPNIRIVDETFRPGGVVELKLAGVDDIVEPEKPKKPFVLDEHLTQRPFKDDRLMQLKSALQRQSSTNR